MIFKVGDRVVVKTSKPDMYKPGIIEGKGYFDDEWFILHDDSVIASWFGALLVHEDVYNSPLYQTLGENDEL